MPFAKRGGEKVEEHRKQHKVPTVTKTPGHAHAGARNIVGAPPTTSSGDAGSSGQVCWAYHPSQRDEDNVQQPLSSAVVRGNMQDLLMQGRDSYREGFGMVTRMNPEVAELVRRHTVSARNQGRYERSRSLFGYNDDSDASDTEEEAAMVGADGTAKFGREVRAEMRWAQNHARTMEFLMSLMLRWYNMHSHCFILYALSCLLLATGASGIVWDLLLSLRIVYSKQTIKDSMLQIGHNITEPLWEDTSLSIGFCVSDNCAYMKKLTFQHVETDGCFFETVNYFYFPLRRLRSGRLPELPSSGSCLANSSSTSTLYQVMVALMCSASAQVVGRTRTNLPSAPFVRSWRRTHRRRAKRSSIPSGPSSLSGTATTCSFLTRSTGRTKGRASSCTCRPS